MAMVTRNPSDDEITGHDLLELSDDEFSYTPNHPDDLKEKALAMLYFFRLYRLYSQYQDKSLDYILKNIDNDIDKLNVYAKDSLQSNVETYKNKVRKEQLKEYKLEPSLKKADLDVTSTNDVLVTTLISTHEQLRNDTKMKVKVWIDRNNPITNFNLNPNFKRALSRYNQAFKYATNTITQKSDREIKSFVFKPETRYLWVCFGKHPCAWCIDQSKEQPRLLEDIPYDHINGWCGVIPAKEEYSDEYLSIMREDYHEKLGD